jgi:riboflavin biosynthesis pyrimidine reductase
MPMNNLSPLDTLYETSHGDSLPLSSQLAELYGDLQFPMYVDKPYVVANLVTSLDGVVSFDLPGHPGGGDISGSNPHDRMVMGILRAAADAVIVGAGTLRATPGHVWTAEHIYPQLKDDYKIFRKNLGKSPSPLNVIVTTRGEIDLNLPLFQSSGVPVLIVTSPAGAIRIRSNSPPQSARVLVLEKGRLSTQNILKEVNAIVQGSLILVEGGPHLLGDFIAEQCLDEQFLTLAPQIVGRNGDLGRPGLVAGNNFAPENPVWGTLLSVKRGGSLLFLRYALGPGEKIAR